MAAAALLWGVAYLTWRVGWSGDGADPVLFVLLLAAEGFGWASLGLYAFMAWRLPPSARPVPGRPYDVDLFVCTYDEPVEVLRATLLGCRAVRYPHTTWLLDDGRRPEMAALAAELGAGYLARPDNRHAKAGNVNHALARTRGELVAVLDADHVPLPHFFDALVGYFDDDEVALVQTPHEFFNLDSIQHTRRGRHEQALFFRVICSGKDRHNATFWCGSSAVIRRAALEGVGGVRHDTIAEDFHTTIALHQQGWRTRYHDEVLVQGRAPHDLGAFLLQRDRWARGNLRVFRTAQNPLTARGLTARQRLSYTASLLNYFSGPQRLALLAVLAATLLTGRLPMVADPWAIAALWAPWSALSFGATIALARGRLGPTDSARYGMMTAGIFTMAALSLLWSGARRFKVTPKEGVDRGGAIVVRQLWLLSTLGAVVLTAAALRALEALGLVPLAPLPPFALAVTLALATYEVTQIGRLVVELVRRRQQRSDYRLGVELVGRMGDAVVRIVDLTPRGLAVLAPAPLPPGTPVTVHVGLPGPGGRATEVTLDAEARSCADLGDGTWRIGLRIAHLDDHDRNALTEYCFVYAAAPADATDAAGATAGTALPAAAEGSRRATA